MDKYIGRLLDNRYEIMEIIGTGGMAVVYKARCHRLNRLVAIKILKDEYSQDDDFRRRFHAEGQAVAMLSHPNIVSVYDVSTTQDADYIVMELIDGISLKQYMEKKGVLNWKETLHFAMQIAKALEHAHSRGIIHRDIKPHNVMVLKNGSVKVADFGIARVVSKSNTLTKEALGSVHYISPEQAKGSRVDNRSDLYSLGVVMYEMMTGRPPYDGESPVSVAIQHINGGAVMPSTLNPNIPGGLEQIIMKSMALEPGNRYASATVMLYDMDEFRKDPGIIFSFGQPNVDDSTRILEAPVGHNGTHPARSRAERAAGMASGAPRRRTEPQRGGSRRTEQPRKRRPEPEPEEEKESSVATIAIVAVSVAAIVAIGIFLWLILTGGLMGQKELVTVPNLVGQVYDDDMSYPDFEIVLQKSSYNEQYARGQIFEQKPDYGDEVEPGTKIFISVSMGAAPQAQVMEDLVGVEATTAIQFLKDLGYNPLMREEYSEEVEEGKVLRTDPKKGEELTDGQTITIWVSKGSEIVKANMPNVVGQDVETAIKLLKASGFENVECRPVESNEEKDTVISQSEKKNTKVDVTTLIILEISKGPEETTAPPTTEPEETTVPPTTEPEPTETEPTVPAAVTKKFYIQLPTGMTAAYELRLKQGDVDVLDPITIEDLTLTQIEVELTGTGVQEYILYVNGEPYGDPIVIDFTNANG